MCGEHQNRLAVLESGFTACARIQFGNKGGGGRPNFSAFKEELAFHLARLLGINNLPTVVVSQVRLSSTEIHIKKIIYSKLELRDFLVSGCVAKICHM